LNDESLLPNLVVAFKELGIAAVRVGTLDLGMLRAL